MQQMLKIGTYPGSDEWEVQKCAAANLKRRPLCLNPGSVGEILFTLLNYLNIDYELKVHKEGQFGKLFNGMWTPGLFHDVLTRNLDTLGVYAVVHPSRMKYFSFT